MVAHAKTISAIYREGANVVKAEVRSYAIEQDDAIDAEAATRQAAIAALQEQIASVESYSHYLTGGPVARATTANVVLSGEQVIDGVLTSATRVLVRAQSAPAQNGVYVTAAGAWARAGDADSAAELGGALVLVMGGNTLAGRTYLLALSPSAINVGVTALPFTEVAVARKPRMRVAPLGGQSNQAGSAPAGEEAYEVAPVANRVLQYLDGSISDATGLIQRGLWPVFGNAVWYATQEPICFVMLAPGGSSQVAATDEVDGYGTWDTTASGNLTEEWIALIHAALLAVAALGYEPVLEDAFWFQGESDALAINDEIITDDDYADAYQATIAAVRAEFGATLAWNVIRIGTATGHDDEGFRQVREVQEFLALNDPHCFIICRDVLALVDLGYYNLNNIHPRQRGYNKIGEIAASNYLSRGARNTFQTAADQGRHAYFTEGDVSIGTATTYPGLKVLIDGGDLVLIGGDPNPTDSGGPAGYYQGFDAGNNVAFGQGIVPGSSFRHLVLQPLGGRLGVGLGDGVAPSVLLHVGGDVYAGNTNKAGSLRTYGASVSGDFGTIGMDGSNPGRMVISPGGGAGATENACAFACAIHPTTDNTLDCGKASLRWANIRAGTGTIQTSDGDTKTNTRKLNASEIAAARELATMPRIYQFKDAVAQKGANARLHVGFVFQEVVAVLEKHGIDPDKFGIVCRDPLLAPVKKTRPAKRQKVDVTITRTEVIEQNAKGEWVQSFVDDRIETRVTKREPLLDGPGGKQIANVIEKPLTEPKTGEPIIDPKTKKQKVEKVIEPRWVNVPVMEDFEEEYFEDESVMVEGQPAFALALRPDELHAFIIAGLSEDYA